MLTSPRGRPVFDFRHGQKFKQLKQSKKLKKFKKIKKFKKQILVNTNASQKAQNFKRVDKVDAS